MQNQTTPHTKASLALLLLIIGVTVAQAQPTAFTYQGQLLVGGQPANGDYDLRFRLYDSLEGGGLRGGPLTVAPVAVSNGFFTLALDFGSAFSAVDSPALEIDVRTNGSAGAYTTLVPRQAVSRTPYAIRAFRADTVTGAIPDGQLSANIPRLNANQSFTGSNTFLTVTGAPFAVAGNTNKVGGLNTDFLDGLDSTAFWKLLGNGGTGSSNFVGTTDNQALELRVNNGRALRIEPTAATPNLIGGFSGNVISNGSSGSVIAGGGFSGNINRVSGSHSTVSGGYNNEARGGSAVVGGGDGNTASNDRATVGGGYTNRASGRLSTVAGGDNNTASGLYSAVPGGTFNVAGGDYSLAAGQRAKATNQGAFVWADSLGGDFASTSPNQFLIRASGGVGIGLNNPSAALDVNGRVKMTQFQLGNSATAGAVLTADGSGVGSWQTASFLPTTGGTLTGDLTIANPADLNFGSSTRQMINLFGTTYGIGVQANTLYQRSDNDFAWYRDGVHNDGQGNPGTSGSNIMYLDWSGHLQVNAGVSVDSANANTGSHYPGVLFGLPSGEAISSKRQGGGTDLYGIDFYTGFQRRMSINNNGNVGIGTTNPLAKFEVATGVGNFQVRGDGVTPGINIANGFFGTLRMRRAIEIWPDDPGANAGYLDVRATNGATTISLNGASGEATVKVLTITGGADLAEPFQISSGSIPKGALVVIDEENPGQLRMSDRAYDTRVAGIISGAGGIHPGIALKQEGVVEAGQNVALTGRVYALADAAYGVIKPGDLLTTSDTPGHAMKVGAQDRASGTVIGKAMTGLKDGRGLVLVLVNLQ